jgi:Carboxypeptidase regulatory-like domain/TonB-dependent Receptor Plug Domain
MNQYFRDLGWSLILLLPGLAFGQTCVTGRVRVSVQDNAGRPVSSAVVTLEGGIKKSTGPEGIAEFDGVTCGAHAVSISKDGFQPLDGGSVQVKAEAPAEVNVTLIPQIVQRESVEVHDTAPAIDRNASDASELQANQVRDLPSRPATVTDVLPLIPGVVRSPDGEIKINGTGEHRSAFVVNKADVTDPATGKFGEAVPVDSVETVNVFKTPFMAQYGRFTAGVVSVETRRGGDKWHADLNDPFPDFRFRSWHMVGIRDVSPRFVLGGPIIADRLYFAQTLQYDLMKKPDRTLPYPHNESKKESVNSFTQLDYILSPKQFITGTFHITPQHVNFVDPQYFDPQPVTPNYRQHNYVGTISDHLGIGNGMLESTVSIQRFDAAVGAQGAADMVLTPVGNSGNYFSSQNREAGRTEWLETWSPAPVQKFGTHELKFGSGIARTSDGGEFTARPIEILDTSGLLLRRIDFTGGSPYSNNDVETALFAQDHWSLNSKMSLDLGTRVERQNIAESFRIAPRLGFAWAPFGGQQTVFRAGYGVFYDRVPLNVYNFDRYPQQVVTTYGPDGSILGNPIEYFNITGRAVMPNSLLIHNTSEPGSFAPHSSTWNVQAEHSFSHFLRLRAIYTDSHSSDLIILQPEVVQGVGAMLLNGGGHSQYRQAEVTARLSWKDGQQFFLSYTRSRAQGDLNDFNNFLGNFPTPLIRPNTVSNLPGDLPNRFLAWGRVSLPWQMQILPIVEYRNGFPYAQYDALGNYVGTPNSDQTRFPNFLSVDARVVKDVKVNPKYTFRFSVSAFNLTNHFNALSVHSNIADPQVGAFFGNYKRRFRADFDVVF